MKTHKIKFLTLFIAAMSFFATGCQEEFVDSKPTFWPDIQINGDEYVVVEVGDTYTDAGATVTVNGSPIPYESESDVDVNEIGAYTVTYTAVNEDGIAASKVRTVVVVEPDAADDDLTGSYTRVGQIGVVCNWAKHPTRAYCYIANNPGGVPPSNASYAAFNVQYFVYNVAPGIIVVPLQQVGALAPFFCSASLGGSLQIAFNVSAAPGDVAYAWVVNGANFGTGLRTFRKL